MSDDAQVECCGNCRFWQILPGNKVGACRCNPPTAIMVGMGQHPVSQKPMPLVDGFFATTRADIWCGRHEFRVGTSMSIDDRLTAPAEGAA